MANLVTPDLNFAAYKHPIINFGKHSSSNCTSEQSKLLQQFILTIRMSPMFYTRRQHDVCVKAKSLFGDRPAIDISIKIDDFKKLNVFISFLLQEIFVLDSIPKEARKKMFAIVIQNMIFTGQSVDSITSLNASFFWSWKCGIDWQRCVDVIVQYLPSHEIHQWL